MVIFTGKCIASNSKVTVRKKKKASKQQIINKKNELRPQEV